MALRLTEEQYDELLSKRLVKIAKAEPNTVFERRRLRDIVCFLEVQNEDHKRMRAAAKAAARGIE